MLLTQGSDCFLDKSFEAETKGSLAVDYHEVEATLLRRKSRLANHRASLEIQLIMNSRPRSGDASHAGRNIERSI